MVTNLGPKIWSLKLPAVRVLVIWVVMPAVMAYLKAWWKNKQKVQATDQDTDKVETDLDFLIDCIFTPVYRTVKILSASFEGILCLGTMSPSIICKEQMPIVSTAIRMIAVIHLTQQMGENLVVYIISKLNMSYNQKKACLLGVKVFSVAVFLIGCLAFLEYAGLGFF